MAYTNGSRCCIVVICVLVVILPMSMSVAHFHEIRMLERLCAREESINFTSDPDCALDIVYYRKLSIRKCGRKCGHSATIGVLTPDSF